MVNPSAPLEKQLNFNEVLKITRYAKKNNITVLLDEVYRNFSENQSIQYINRFNNLIIVKSFSKMVGYPGIRAGFAICKRDIFLELDSYRLSIEIPSYTVKKMTKILNNPKQIRKSEINVQKVLEYAKKDLSKQLKRASKVKADYCIILGDEESKENKVIVKHMTTRKQDLIERKKLISYFKSL